MTSLGLSADALGAQSVWWPGWKGNICKGSLSWQEASSSALQGRKKVLEDEGGGLGGRPARHTLSC